MSKIEYVTLTGEDWPAIADLAAEYDITPENLPHPDLCAAAGAVDTEAEELLAVLFLQMCWHLEPLLASRAAAGRFSASALKTAIERAVKPTLEGGGSVRYYVQVADVPEVRAAVEREGLKPVVGMVLYEGRIEP